ncbi:MAG: YlqD family protein, partial [Veillonella sp.]|nr:YlqD family protein [Veillonella sp.]
YCLKGSIPMEEMTLRVPVAVKAKVTEDLKAKIVSDLETRLDMVNKDLEAIEFQAQRILADAAKVDATSLTAIRQQIDEEKNKRLAFKEEVTAKLKDAQELSLGTEIPQGTLEQTVTVKIGDNLDAMMGAEILLEDGKIVAFRQ